MDQYHDMSCMKMLYKLSLMAVDITLHKHMHVYMCTLYVSLELVTEHQKT